MENVKVKKEVNDAVSTFTFTFLMNPRYFRICLVNFIWTVNLLYYTSIYACTCDTFTTLWCHHYFSQPLKRHYGIKYTQWRSIFCNELYLTNVYLFEIEKLFSQVAWILVPILSHSLCKNVSFNVLLNHSTLHPVLPKRI